MPRVHIRPYRPEDRRACASLWAELSEHHRRLYGNASVGDRGAEHALDDYLRTARAWVAERDGEIVGLAGTIPHGEKAELEPVVVHAAVRRQGVGRRLVDAAVEDARQRGARQIFVRPVARNLDAIRFFRLCGLDVLTRVELSSGLSAGTPVALGRPLDDLELRG